MARIVFTPVRAAAGKAFRAQIMDIQQRMQEWADTARMSPKSKPYIADAVSKFAAFLGSSILANGASVAVRNSAVSDTINGTAVVTGAGVLTGINLPATTAMVDNAEATVPLGDATAVAAGQDVGTVTVAAGVISRVTLPTGDKIIKTTVKYLAPAATGSYVNGYTFTIVAGVITAVVMS